MMGIFRRMGILFQDPAGLETVHDLHLVVHDDQIMTVGLGVPHGVDPVVEALHPETGRFQKLLEGLAHDRIVIHDEDGGVLVFLEAGPVGVAVPVLQRGQRGHFALGPELLDLGLDLPVCTRGSS